jgi:hypothetical protein
MSARASDDLQTGWSAWFNTHKFNDRWSLISDVHVRTADDWSSVRTGIARVGGSYALTKSISLGAGYAYIGTYSPGGRDLSEHRLWQQAVHRTTFGDIAVSQRLRLEQRRLERLTGSDLDSWRLRYQLRLTKPLGERWYVTAQNEAFAHLSGRRQLTGKAFDQNRASLGFGWKATPAVDVEAGYLNQFIKGRTVDTQSHAVQINVVTRF